MGGGRGIHTRVYNEGLYILGLYILGVYILEGKQCHTGRYTY